MFLSALLSVIGLGFLCWLLFNLAVYALPFFVAVTVGHYALENGAGPVGAVVIALFAGAIALVLGQVVFATIRSPTIRLALGGLYALPAGVAGFHAIKGLSETGGAGETWTLVFASIGAVIVGVTAWMRIASLTGPEIRTDDVAAHHAGRAAKDG
ncbi:MAG: hypothetical protein ACK4HG_01435 [Agrobacterium albertimagni]